MADKEVKIKVGVDAELSKVQALEDNIAKIKLQKIQLDIQANTAKLEDVNSKIESTKAKLQTLQGKADVDDSEVKQLEQELERLEADKLNIQLDIETGKLDEAKSKLDRIDDESINPQINTISAMEGIEQIGQGFDRLKQGASEIGQQMGVVLEAAGKQETNKSFLQLAVGADTAAQKMNEINSVVQNLPGDDTVMQGLLSSAVAKDASLTSDALQEMGTSAADYFSAMSFYGKSATEAQQDMTNYLLAGNTAELERSPILQGHIDKLKEGTSVQERAKLLQEALNQEHWGGMSQQDTYNNKLETFNGMLERGKYNLGGMFQEGAKKGMDFVMQLDSASGGIVGMGIALAGFATPLADAVMGLGQMATGIKALKDLEIIKWFKDLELMTKLSAAADYILAGAQAVLNFVMSMNPIVLVVLALVALAAALIWAYYNVDWFRAMVDNAWQSLVQLGQQLYGIVAGAITWVMNLFNQFTTQLGLNTNDWIQAIIAFILFIPQLPLKVGIALANALAKTLGFGDNFVSSLINSASSAVSGFVSYITQLPGIVMDEFNRVLGLVNDFINSLPDRVWDMGQAIIDALKKSLGIGSPGHMFYMLEGEFERMEDLPGDMENDITRNVKTLGSGIVNSFDPNLNGSLNREVASGAYGNTANFYFSDIIVDDDKRMEKIYDYITRRLNFNNKTARRSV